MVTVVVLTTGGTIASRPDPDAGAVRVAQRGRELGDLVAGMVPDVRIHVDDVMQVGSYQMTPEMMAQLARACAHHARSADVAGLVVTHGTDTMEESAYVADLLCDGDKPIVFTGAQRNAAESDSDGPRNLRDAVRLAAFPAARGSGAVICMAGRVEGARNAVKVATQAPQAFGAPGHGPVGEVTDEAIALFGSRFRPRNLVGVERLSARVDLVKLAAGTDGALVRAATQAGARGIVVEAFGIGNANHDVCRAVGEAVEHGVTVLVSSRCSEGFVSPVYGDGGGRDLLAAGAIFAGNLRPTKARILLMAVLEAAGSDARVARDLMEPHLAL